MRQRIIAVSVLLGLLATVIPLPSPPQARVKTQLEKLLAAPER